MRLGAPERRRLEVLGRGEIAANHPEELADEAFRRPVGEPDPAAAAQHAQHLRGRTCVLRRKHGAKSGQHHIETAVREWQRLGIGDLEGNLQSFGVGTRSPLLEQRGNIVGRGDLREATRGGKGGIAVTGRDIEHALARAHVHRLGKRLAHDLQGSADDGEITARPGGLLLRLEGREVGCWETPAGDRRNFRRAHEFLRMKVVTSGCSIFATLRAPPLRESSAVDRESADGGRPLASYTEDPPNSITSLL